MLWKRIQHQLSQATWRRAIQQAEPAQAGEIRQRENHFNRRRRSGGTGFRACRSAPGARISSAHQIEIYLCRRASSLAESGDPAPAYYLWTDRNCDRQIVVDKSEFAEY